MGKPRARRQTAARSGRTRTILRKNEKDTEVRRNTGSMKNEKDSSEVNPGITGNWAWVIADVHFILLHTSDLIKHKVYSLRFMWSRWFY